MSTQRDTVALPDATRVYADNRLERISRILNVPPSFFLKNVDGGQWPTEPDFGSMKAFLDTPEGQKLIANFVCIEDDEVRQRLIELTMSIVCYRRLS